MDGILQSITVYDDWIDSDEIPQVVPEMLDEWEEFKRIIIDQGNHIQEFWS